MVSGMARKLSCGIVLKELLIHGFGNRVWNAHS